MGSPFSRKNIIQKALTIFQPQWTTPTLKFEPQDSGIRFGEILNFGLLFNTGGDFEGLHIRLASESKTDNVISKFQVGEIFGYILKSFGDILHFGLLFRTGVDFEWATASYQATF